MPSSTDPAALADATALGLSAIAQILTQTDDGVTVIDSEGRWVYANPAACVLLDRSPAQLRGQRVCSGDEGGGHPLVKADLDDREPMTPALFSGRLMSPDVAEREIVYLTCAVDIDGEQAVSVAIFRDVAGPNAAAHAAVAMAQTAAQLVSGATTNDVVNGIARHAVTSTRAVAAGIYVCEDDHRLSLRGGFGLRDARGGSSGPISTALIRPVGEEVIAAMTAGSVVVGAAPGKAVVLPDARAEWDANPALSRPGFVVAEDWRAAICVPLAWQSRVFGVMVAHLPLGVDGPDEMELAVCSALADQASIAIANARLTAQSSYAATLEERSRLARDLHDSVSQALFSMTMHARAAELTLAKAGGDPASPLGRSIAQLGEVARGTLAEMRALIFELRPEALAEEGLVGALRKRASALAAREQLSVTVSGSEEPLGLSDDVQEHLFRLASEALSLAVKHEEATQVDLLVSREENLIRLTIRDDGGLSSAFSPDEACTPEMAQRAAAIGAVITVVSPRETTIFLAPLGGTRPRVSSS